ncbi:hypothetical protein WG66_014433, partial [Moniliophthora roreri]
IVREEGWAVRTKDYLIAARNCEPGSFIYISPSASPTIFASQTQALVNSSSSLVPKYYESEFTRIRLILKFSLCGRYSDCQKYFTPEKGRRDS